MSIFGSDGGLLRDKSVQVMVSRDLHRRIETEARRREVSVSTLGRQLFLSALDKSDPPGTSTPKRGEKRA
jgi:hypothetical protein